MSERYLGPENAGQAREVGPMMSEADGWFRWEPLIHTGQNRPWDEVMESRV